MEPSPVCGTQLFRSSRGQMEDIMHCHHYYYV